MLPTCLGPFDRGGHGVGRRGLLRECRFALRAFVRFALQAMAAQFKSFTCRVRSLALKFVHPDCRLAVTKPLHQSNMAGAHQVATTAFAAVEKVMVPGTWQAVGAKIPEQLLWLQLRWTDCRAVPPADAGHFVPGHGRRCSAHRFNGR